MRVVANPALPLLRSLRPAQWVKNIFVLLPVAFAGELDDPEALLRAVIAFAVFCALSSSVYLLNDLVDRERDRLHPVKRHRPLASGALQPAPALAAALLLLFGALAVAGWLGTTVLVLSGAYLLQNVLYSMLLKHVVILDIMVVAVGFVLRVLMGGQAVGVAVSQWLLLCTIFLALFLAASKRRHELLLLEGEAVRQREVLGHYSTGFVDQIIHVVTASTLMAYALYTTSDETIERFGPYLLYTVAFVLFGIFRYLYLVYQVRHPKNPTEAMLTDPPFVLNLVLWAGTVGALLYL